MSILVTVYGSLKKGFHNNFLLENQKFIGNVLTKEKYCMYNAGKFPILTKENKDHIKGELYSICSSTLYGLDYLEQNGVLYKREIIDVVDSNENIHKSYIYFYIAENIKYKNYNKYYIPNGNWVKEFIKKDIKKNAK